MDEISGAVKEKKSAGGGTNVVKTAKTESLVGKRVKYCSGKKVKYDSACTPDLNWWQVVSAVVISLGLGYWMFTS